MRNLSVTGVGLILPRRFEPGTVITVVLQSPDGRVRRSLEMRVRHASRAPGGRWCTGGTFPQPLGKDELRRLV